MHYFFVSVFTLPFALAFPFSFEKAGEAMSPKALMTMNTGNAFSNTEIFINFPFLIISLLESLVCSYERSMHAKL